MRISRCLLFFEDSFLFSGIQPAWDAPRNPTRREVSRVGNDSVEKDVDENRGKLLFQLFFLKDNENQSVEIEEIEEIDFRGVKERLEQGESVFITRKCKQKMNSNVIVSEEEAEVRYFTHI